MDLPFIWTAPTEDESRARVMCPDAPSLVGVPAALHGLEGNDHLQQPFVYERVFDAQQCDRIRELGGEASDSSGAWGAWAKTVQGTMNLFGDASALKSLKEGEEHGLKDYQEAIDDVDPSSGQLIQNQLIPAQQRHINLLDQLISSAGRA